MSFVASTACSAAEPVALPSAVMRDGDDHHGFCLHGSGRVTRPSRAAVALISVVGAVRQRSLLATRNGAATTLEPDRDASVW
jgi:hypothetical protein